MSTSMPPIVPDRTESDDGPRARVRFRMMQVSLSMLTLVVTCWLWMIHPIAGITATFLAKHVLVAILAAGIDYPQRR